ncbi:MAG: acylneuraminate cytidylyltransferase family protein [Crocinitomicaceae bacterium]
MTITALVPIKKESERLLNKNFLSFNGRPMYTCVLETLEKCPLIDKIVVNTDAQEIASFVKNELTKGHLIRRPEHLFGNEITMNSIIAYDLSQVSGEHFLQTHVTNPLLSIETIEKAIATYFDQLEQFDSLISVNAIKKRAFDAQLQPINHDNTNLLMTQDLPPILIENSNLFLFSRASYEQTKSRIGRRPQAFSMHELESLDIDHESDFKLAQLIDKNKDSLGLPG